MASPPFAWARATATLLLVASTLSDLSTAGLLILIVSLVVAFGFEFVNGFHDTSNAVATVIYTHSLKPVQAVVWSGLWNFLGVMYATTTGLAVAFSIVHFPAGQPAHRLRMCGPPAGPDETSPESPARALRAAARPEAASLVDPLPARLHLYRRELRPRLERRAEGHRSHHADAHRRSPRGLRREPALPRAGDHRDRLVTRRPAGLLRQGGRASGSKRKRSGRGAGYPVRHDQADGARTELRVGWGLADDGARRADALRHPAPARRGARRSRRQAQPGRSPSG